MGVIVVQLIDGRYIDEDNPDQEEPAPELVAAGREPIKVNRWLVVALVVALAGVAVLAGLRYVEHRQTPDERAVAAVVAADRTAWNAGDSTQVLQGMTPTGSWTAVWSPTEATGQGPYSGVELAGFVQLMHSNGYRLTATGPLTILRGSHDWTAAQPTHVSFTMGGSSIEQDGWVLLTIIDDHGTKRISQNVWWLTKIMTTPPES